MEYVKFKDITLSTQYGYTAGETSKTEGKYKYLRITDIVPYYVNMKDVPFCSIPEKMVSQYIVHEGDILIARTGATTGYNYVVQEDVKDTVYASYLIRFVVDRHKVSPLYMKYVLKSQSYYAFINNYIGGSAQPGMNARVFGRFNIPYHPLPIQQKIASILSTYDNLIENNTKRIKLLEQMAENLYKEWFVRFRFPGHENTPMENGLPKGWKRGILSDIANINPSRMLKKGSFATYLDMGNMPTKGSFPSDWCVQQYNGGAKFTNGDILMARITPCLENGKVAYVNFLNEGEIAFGSTEYIVLTPKDNTIAPFIYNLCRTSHFIGYASNGMVGASGRQRVSGDVIGKYELTIPSEKIINEVKTLFDTLYSQIRPLSFQNRLFAKQRDLLLPRLMSGKLEVTP